MICKRSKLALNTFPISLIFSIMRFIDFFIVSAIVRAVTAGPIQLYARSVSTGTTSDFGILDVDTQTFELSFSDRGSFCIGTTAIDNHDCFEYIEVSEDTWSPLTVQVFLGPTNEILRLSLIQGSSVVITKESESPSPNFNTTTQKTPEKRKAVVKSKKTVVEVDEDGKEVVKEVEVEEPVDERSWLQKNWIYVVIPLVLLMLLTDDKNKTG